MTNKLNLRQRFKNLTPSLKRKLQFAVLGLVLLSMGSGFLMGQWLGFRLGANSLGDTARAYKKAIQENEGFKEKLEVLETSTAEYKQERDVAVSNLKGYREQLAALRDKEALYKLQAQGYKEAYSGEQQLKLVGAQITTLPQNAYEYEFDVMMVSSSKQKPRSTVFELTLTDGSSVVKVPLENSRVTLDGLYRLNGRFIMPSGFSPKQMHFSAVSGTMELNKRFAWTYSGKAKNVAPSLQALEPLKQTSINSSK